MQKNNIPYYLTAVVLFILFKFIFTHAENNDLTFLLKPTDTLVGFLTGSHSIYFPDTGYYHSELHILIDKSCSGFNFWMLSFVSFTFLAVRYFDIHLHKILALSMALVASYLLTLFVNTSRIFVSIIVHAQTKNIFAEQQHMLHEAIGIITNLTFLVLAYYIIEKIFIYTTHNAKLT